MDTVMQLAHLISNDIGLSGREGVILNTIYLSKNKIQIDNLQNEIHNIFRIVIENELIKSHITSLVNNGHIVYVAEYLYLSPATTEKIRDAISKNEVVEKEALNDWNNQFEEIYHIGLSTSEQDVFKEKVDTFLKTVFLSHGVASYEIFTEYKTRTNANIKAILSDVIRNIKPINKSKYSHFLSAIFSSQLTKSQRQYIQMLISRSVEYLSTVSSEDVIEKIKENLSNTTIYLDTSILYRLLNLQGLDRYESVKRTVELCTEYGMRLKVLKETYKELDRRIKYDARMIEQHPTPSSFAEIGYKCRTEENYISAFWNIRKLHKIEPQDFNAKYKNLELLLSEYKIEIDTEDYSTIISESELSDITDKIVKFDDPNPEYKKSPNAIQHDAYCIGVVLHLRGGIESNAFDGKCLFLSSDQNILRMQKFDKDYGENPDIMVLPSQLVQMLCVSKPVDTYLETFLGLFSSSKISSKYQLELTNQDINKILSKLSLYDGMTESIAEKILTNQLIRDRYPQVSNDQEEQECIDSAIGLELKALEDNVTQLENISEEKDQIIKNVKQENETQGHQISDLIQRITELEEKQKLYSEQLNEKENSISSFESETRALQERFSMTRMEISKTCKAKARKKTNIRFYGPILLLGIGCLLILTLILSFIPFSSPYMAHVFNVIRQAETLKEISNEGIIGIILALALPPISFGGATIWKGKKHYLNKYYKNYLEREIPKYGMNSEDIASIMSTTVDN